MNGLLVGHGNMGRNHARLLKQRDHDISLVDPIFQPADHPDHGFKNCYATLAEALAEDRFDFAIIAAPSSLHYEIAKELIGQGIDILVEKPLSDTLETAEDLARLATENGVKMLPGHVERYNPAVRFLKERLTALGTDSVYRVEVVRCSPFPARITDVGVAADLSVHDLDAINFLMGEQATSVYCRRSQKMHATQEDGVLAILNFNDKFDCQLNTNWTSPLRRRELRIFGAWGMFVLDFMAQEVSFQANADYLADEPMTALTQGEATIFDVQKGEPLRNEHDHFFTGLAAGTGFDEEVQSAINVIKTVGKFATSHAEKREVQI